MKKRAYVAGPLFDDGERWWAERLDTIATSVGFETFLPHRDNPPKTAGNVGGIFDANCQAIRTCDVMVANLNGITTDDGTAWEVGYAYALNIPVVGVYTDWRYRFESEVVNLMIERSLAQLVRSADELAQVLTDGTWATSQG